jgi:hypothetical protein
MPFDPFDLDDAGFDDSYTGTITDVTYEAGKFDFQATITTKHDEPRTKNDGTMSFERKEFIKLGGLDQGFVATDNGAGYTNNENKKPRGNSAWGRFITRVIELNGGKKPESLVGLHLTWDREGADKPYKFTDKVTGEVKEGTSKGYMIPVALLGTAGASNGQVKADFDLSSLRTAGMTPVIESDLAKDAKASGTAQEFLARAVTHDDVKANNAIVGALADPAFWSTLKAQ